MPFFCSKQKKGSKENKKNKENELVNCQVVMAGNFKFTNQFAPEALDDSGWRRRRFGISPSPHLDLLPPDDDIENKPTEDLGSFCQWALAFPDSYVKDINKAGQITEWLERDSLDQPFSLAVKVWIAQKITWG